MAKKQGPDRGKVTPQQSDLSQYSEALAKSAQSLQESTDHLAKQLVQTPGRAVPVNDDSQQHTPAAEANHPSGTDSPQVRGVPATTSRPPSAERYYAQLEQTGQLADVDENTDLSKLSPRITHVRHPDGRVERLGYS